MFRDERTFTTDNRLIVKLLLPIRLRMIRSREHAINYKYPTEVAEELGYEFLAVVGENVGGVP